MAGQGYSFMAPVPHLVEPPTIQWVKASGSVIIAYSTGTSLTLGFNPLRLSDGDLYTCHASIDITDVTPTSSEVSIDVAVASECI